MGLDAVIRSGVATANKVTDSLQVQVTIRPWIAQDTFGKDTFGSAKKYRALVEQGERQFKTQTGVMINVQATVTFLKPIVPNGADGRTEPIDDRDIITLPDGTTGPTMIGEPVVVDPKSSKPYFQVVGIGKS